MRHILLTITFILCSCYSIFAQSDYIYLTNACMVSEIKLNKINDISGKPAYQGIGTVDSYANTTVSIYWMGAPDNVWVIDFDGQPYFSNSSAVNTVPLTNTGVWNTVISTDCTVPSLTVESGFTLPVSLGGFAVQELNGDVNLSWKTYSEINNKGFYVQKSKDGSAWEDIGFVVGMGNSNSIVPYTFIDKSVTGSNYYRLKQMDNDGKVNYSSVIYFSSSKISALVVKNNPSNGLYNVLLPSVEQIQINVFDMNGREVYMRKELTSNTNIDITDKPSGLYLLQVIIGKKVFTSKLIKR